MNDLKKIIDREIDTLIPNDYYDSIRVKVMQTIPRSQKHLNLSFADKRDNIFLFFMIIFCSGLIYFFGYNEHYKLSILISKNLVSNVLTNTIAGISLIIVCVNEYFDRKKKYLFK